MSYEVDLTISLMCCDGLKSEFGRFSVIVYLKLRYHNDNQIIQNNQISKQSLRDLCRKDTCWVRLSYFVIVAGIWSKFSFNAMS
jgi:hypothetical protein